MAVVTRHVLDRDDIGNQVVAEPELRQLVDDNAALSRGLQRGMVRDVGKRRLKSKPVQQPDVPLRVIHLVCQVVLEIKRNVAADRPCVDDRRCFLPRTFGWLQPRSCLLHSTSLYVDRQATKEPFCP